MKNIITKALAITLNLALVGSSYADVPGASAAPKMPDFVQPFVPPTSLGYVTNFFKGQTENPVILIQDLHANLGVQKKIAGMLDFLQPKVAASGPMVVGVEGAWGTVDLSPITKQQPKVRDAVSNFLLKEAEMSGMEYFAALSKTPVTLSGIENPQDYIVHVKLFQKSLAARLKLAHKLNQLRSIVNVARGKAPRELKRLWRIEEDFHAGKIDLGRMEKELNRSLSNYGEAEKALEEAKMAMANAREGDEAFYLRNVVLTDHMISLLSRLLRQQLTMEEVQYAAKQIPAMITVVRALLPGENIKLWQDTIQTAIDHYAIALVRDTPMAERAAQLAKTNAGKSVVVVAGGFHADGIQKQLQQKKISYVTLAPVVESHTAKDERIYLMRMLDKRVSQGVFRDRLIGEAIKMAHTVNAPTAVVAAQDAKLTSEVASNGAAVIQTALSIFIKNPAISFDDAEKQLALGRPMDPTLADEIEKLVGEHKSAAAGSKEFLANLFGRLTGRDKFAEIDVNKTAQTAAELKIGGTQAGKGTLSAGVVVTGVAAVALMAGVAVSPAAQDALKHASQVVSQVNLSSVLTAMTAGSLVAGTVFTLSDAQKAKIKYWKERLAQA